MVLRELRMERNVQQPFLIGRVDTRRAVERLPPEDAVVDTAQCAAAFGNQQVAIREERQTPLTAKKIFRPISSY